MAGIKPAEVSEILKKQLDGFKSEAEYAEIGTVLQVGGRYCTCVRFIKYSVKRNG